MDGASYWAGRRRQVALAGAIVLTGASGAGGQPPRGQPSGGGRPGLSAAVPLPAPSGVVVTPPVPGGRRLVWSPSAPPEWAAASVGSPECRMPVLAPDSNARARTPTLPGDTAGMARMPIAPPGCRLAGPR